MSSKFCKKIFEPRFVQVSPWFPSSKTCSTCGEQIDALPLQVRTWVCRACGAKHDRDVNAAINIKHQGILKLKTAGLSVSASGGMRQTGVIPAAACEAGSPFL